jgi:hypothetical protein
VDLDELVNRFRLASRELFNQFFRIPRPYDNDGWLLEERFAEVEVLLFQKLVIEPAGLPEGRYGAPNPNIRVALQSDHAPIMLNREINSGYWDYPLEEVTAEAQLTFISFFDWDQLAYRDNRYVRVRVDGWPSHVETLGKHAFMQADHVRYAKA